MELKKLTAIVDGVEIELTSEQVEEWCRKKRAQENPFGRKSCGEEYLYIDECFEVHSYVEHNGNVCRKLFNLANYCADKDLMQQRAYWLQLEQLLWREAWLKNIKSITCEFCYVIVFDTAINDWVVICQDQHFFNSFPVFKKYENAKNAIETIVKPFCKEHPDFRP